MDLSALADGTDEKHARRVADLTLRLGALMLGAGGSAAETTAAMLRLTHTYGLEHAHVDVTYTSIIISTPRGPDEDPLTAMRTVRSAGRDYHRLGLVQALVASLASDPVPVSEAHRRFAAIARLPRRYDDWVLTLSHGGTGLGISLMLGAQAAEIVLATLSTMLSFRLPHVLGRHGMPSFFTQVIGAAIPTALALVIVALGGWEPVAGLGISPSRIVAAGIVVLVAGISTMGAARDLIDGFYVTAGARSFDVMSATLGIVLGVSGTLWVGREVGIPGYISHQNLVGAFVPVQLLGAAVSAASNAVSNQATPRAVGICFGAGAGAWGVKTVAEQGLGIGYGAACGVAAVVVAFVAQLVAGRSAIPDQAIAIPAVVSLVPGSMVYRGLTGLFDAQDLTTLSGAVGELLGAAGVGLGLAFGIALGSWLGRPLRLAWNEGARWFENLAVDRFNPRKN